MHEPEKNVRNAIAQLMGTMIKHEVWGWPQLFQVINELVGSNEIEKKELGMYALSVMTEIAPTAPVFLTESLMTLLGQVITTPETSGIGCDYYVIQTLLHLAPMVATHREVSISNNDRKESVKFSLENSISHQSLQSPKF